MMTLAELASRLQGVRQMGDGFVACCPAHDDDQPSLKVSTGRDGRILMHCHAGCSALDVATSLGIKMADLMPDRIGSRIAAKPVSIAKPIQNPTQKPVVKTTQKHEVARYDYQDADGDVKYRVIRYEPKTFRQCKVNADGKMAFNMDGVERVPYHLPEVINAAQNGEEIVIAEGEKDVDNLRKLGFTATCNAGGAGKFDEAWCSYFKGAACVYIIADNDSADKHFPGQKHAWQICKALNSQGIQADVLTLPEYKDASDYIEAKHPTYIEFHDLLEFHAPWPDEWKFGDAESLLAQDDELPLMTLDDFPPYRPEEQNPNILIKGRWLERGGSAWWISTAGTGKSIVSIQLALSMANGLPFAGLNPNIEANPQKLKFWVIQSEDSKDRVAIDREDLTAELQERYPTADWKDVRKRVRFLKISGKVGSAFLQELERCLDVAKNRGQLPDIVIINPFMAYIGGPITDGNYVTPFLRGGEINREPTCGLQVILEKYEIGALIFHHTPKPPSDKEIDSWIKSAFPEYQGSGSSDITNWGRSFVTMMRVKGDPRKVMITAGKNGSELGWKMFDGAYRHYMAYADAIGITGRARHAWRELTEDEIADLTKEAVDHSKEDVEKVVGALKKTPMTWSIFVDSGYCGLPRVRGRLAWNTVTSAYATYGLSTVTVPRTKFAFFGLKKAVEEAAKMAEMRMQNDD